VGQTRHAEGTRDPHRTTEDARSELRQTRELTGTAGQHYAPTRLGRKRGSSEPVAHHFQDLFDPRLDDANQSAARNDLPWLEVVSPERRYRDHVAFVQATT